MHVVLLITAAHAVQSVLILILNAQRQALLAGILCKSYDIATSVVQYMLRLDPTMLYIHYMYVNEYVL